MNAENHNKFTVILADRNRVYLRLITDYLKELRNFEIIEYAFDGRQALDMTMEHTPDLLIMDLIMPRLDCFAVLEELIEHGYNHDTRVILTSAVWLDFVLKKAESFGIDYVFLKPFEQSVFKKRITEIMSQKAFKPLFLGGQKNRSPKEIVTQHIKMVGITANIKGYHYLREAILFVHQDFSLMSRLTKELYVMVADKYDSTPQRVERAMRHAIETAWNRGNLEVLENFFGYTILDTKGKPTNGEFIAMIADKLNHELKIVD